jgi:hypothetical protein
VIREVRSWMLGAVLVLASVLAIVSCGDDKQPITGPPDPEVETFPSEGQMHVADGTPITYNTDPPTSGPHYSSPMPGGFHDTEVPAGYLVHSLEHGGVVIYYHAPALTMAQLDALRTLAAAHPGSFSQVVVVPRNDPVYPVILTAWTHRLRLPSYAQNRIDDFIGAYLGHGPEKAGPAPPR